MRTRTVATLTLALAIPAACRTANRALDGDAGSGTTSVYGHWILATPADSTGFAGASRVELVLSPGTFRVSAAYPGRAPLEVAGRAELAEGGLLTLVPAESPPEAAALGLPGGQPIARLASASGGTLVLAPPHSRVPLPSSVWHRIEVARTAGLAP